MSTERQEFLKSDQISVSTEAKVIWWSRDFTPISVLFPSPGTEFQVPAAAQGESVHSQWHRYSIHARPAAGAGAEILPQMMWYYKTPGGVIQGPFETGKMRHWYAEGFFPDATPMLMICEREGDAIEIDERSVFRPLSDLYPDTSKIFAAMPAAAGQP